MRVTYYVHTRLNDFQCDMVGMEGKRCVCEDTLCVHTRYNDWQCDRVDMEGGRVVYE